MKDTKERKKGHGELAIGAVCVVLGILLSVQLRSVKVNSAEGAAETGRLETLQSLYNDTLDQKEALEAQVAALQTELQTYRESAASGSSQNEALKAEVDKLEMTAGLTDLEGPGVMVSLRDSGAANVTGDEADYLIHDSDLLSVVNELRAAGAEAISLNGERLLATSEIRCTGPTVTVNGRRYTAPFVFNAIGDPTTLYNALTMRNGVADILGQWKIEVKVTASDKLTVPRYAGVTEFHYAVPSAAENSGEEGGE